MKLKTAFYPVLFLFAFLITGCSNIMTNPNIYRDYDEHLVKRDINTVVKKVETTSKKTYGRKDRVIKYLNLGMLYHYQGDYVKSNFYLEKAEQSMETLYTKSVSKAALSILLNDNALAYSGEDYEDIYTNVFKALNYLHLNQFDSAFVEIRRINLKLSLLEDKYDRLAKNMNKSKKKKADFSQGTNTFYNSALGRYLSMMIYLHEGKRDDAFIDFNKIKEAFETQPDIYDFNTPQLIDPLNLLPMPTLHVVSLVGRSPYKKAKDLHIASSKNTITVVGVDEDITPIQLFWPDIDPNYYFKFSLPYIVNDGTQVGRVVVNIDEQTYELQKLEDIGKVAVNTFKVKEPIIMLKSVTRSVIKGIAAESLKDDIKEENPGFWGSVMSLATDAMIFATENADLRISGFFPNAILAADIPLPEGEHNIRIDYYDYSGQLLFIDDRGLVKIDSNTLNLLESWHLQ